MVSPLMFCMTMFSLVQTVGSLKTTSKSLCKTMKAQGHFSNVAECLSYLADEGYLCGGDKIHFVGGRDNFYKITEVRVYGEVNNLLSRYTIGK